MDTKHTCTIKGIFLQLLTHKKEVMLGNAIAIVATLLVVAIPLFIPILVDELLLAKDHGFISWISENLFTSDIKGYVLFCFGDYTGTSGFKYAVVDTSDESICFHIKKYHIQNEGVSTHTS